MSGTWMVLDVSYLCHRAYWAFRGLQFDSVRTGVLYGFLRDLIILQEDHQSDRFVFCFDCPKGKYFRRQEYPRYKRERATTLLDEDGERQEDEDKAEVRSTIQLLREEILFALGFTNVFFQKGYEADDVIASVVAGGKEADTHLIVSADKDLYQLLRDGVIIWNPRTRLPTTARSFMKEYGIPPSKWVDVKAIAGCPGDNVPGVAGVAEATACKYLRGELKKGAKHEAILKWVQSGRFADTIKLVLLPYPGCPDYKPRRDKGCYNIGAWDNLCGKYGFESLMGMQIAPGGRRGSQGV